MWTAEHRSGLKATAAVQVQSLCLVPEQFLFEFSCSCSYLWKNILYPADISCGKPFWGRCAMWWEVAAWFQRNGSQLSPKHKDSGSVHLMPSVVEFPPREAPWLGHILLNNKVLLWDNTCVLCSPATGDNCNNFTQHSFHHRLHQQTQTVPFVGQLAPVKLMSRSIILGKKITYIKQCQMHRCWKKINAWIPLIVSVTSNHTVCL